MKRLFILLSILLINKMFTSSTFADVRLTVSPAKTSIIIKPGITTTIYYDVENRGDPTYVSLELKSLIPNSLYGQLKLIPIRNNDIEFSLQNNDIHLGDKILLKKSEIKRIGVNLKAVPNSDLADHYFAFVVKSNNPSQSSSPFSVNLHAVLASPLFIAVSNNQNIRHVSATNNVNLVGGVKLLFTQTRIIDSLSTLGIRIEVTNDGLYHLTTSGSISIKRQFDKSATVIIQPQIVTANTKKLLESSDNSSGSTPTTYSLKGSFFGKTFITTKIALPTQIETKSFTVLFLPIKFLTVVLFSITLCIFYRKRH